MRSEVFSASSQLGRMRSEVFSASSRLGRMRSSGAWGVLKRTRLRLPIRLKLAVVSAGLTFAILLLFALVVGAFTEQRLRASFDNDVRATAADLQERLRVQRSLSGKPEFGVSQANTIRAAAAGGASIRVVDRNGSVLSEAGREVSLGPPVEGTSDVGDFRVVARPLFAGSLDRGGGFRLSPSPIDGAVAFVQYAKPKDSLDSTTNRLHLFFGLGVLGGTGLAFLAGFAVARRAMRPIAGLTRAAREVARTRDPSRRLPRPAANDEVAELAGTLEEMLGSLDAARSETEASLERQREFVADASHELRTPLTSILANLEMLESELARAEGPRDPQAAAEIAGSALRSSRRMRRLVGDLLLLARADAGRQAPRHPVNLAAAVRDAAVEAGPLAEGHPLSLDLPDDPGEAIVEGSADDLHRLVLNLIENAFLHTPTGTPVVASVTRDTDTLTLQVADRGPGVPAERRDRVFERFARSDAGRTVAGGSGLGLAIVRAVAEAHGGTVELREAQGGGALFAVSLPTGAHHEAGSRVPPLQKSEEAPTVSQSKGT
jgi:two-component system OmpR family sensor kinase